MWGLHFDMRAPSFGAPRTALYENALEMTSWAEQHGCVNVTLSEHHFEDDGYLPSPLVMAAAVAARTSKIRITVSALVLPLHDPIRAAEDVLVVDQISKGRLVVVLVPGYSAREFAGYGVDHASRGALLEQHAVTFVSALSGEPIDRAGTPVRLTPPAVQQPRPIVLVGGSSLAAARRAARVADGFAPSVPDERLAKAYVAECERLGKTPFPVVLPRGPMSVFVTEDPERDRLRVAPHIQHEIASYQRIGAQSRSYASGVEQDPMSIDGPFPVVTPDACIELCRRVRERGNHLLFKPLIGGLDPELGWSSLQLFVDKVLPSVRP